MQQIYEVKVITLTRGGLAGGKKIFSVVTTNCKKSAEVIVPEKKSFREGPNNHKFLVRN